MIYDENSFNIYNLALHEATLDEEDSFFLLSTYFDKRKFFYYYTYPEIEYESICTLANSYMMLYAKVKDININESFTSNRPINIFRYIMLPDGNWSHYYKIKKDIGWVVEGMIWSNGIVYQVREDKQIDFILYQIVLGIDNVTKTMYNFPECFNEKFSI